MDLATITAGGGLEEFLFWLIGAIILGIGAIDTIYKEYYHGRKVYGWSDSSYQYRYVRDIIR